jgi:hypothetical protein
VEGNDGIWWGIVFKTIGEEANSGIKYVKSENGNMMNVHAGREAKTVTCEQKAVRLLNYNDIPLNFAP